MAVPEIFRIISQFIALRGPEFSDVSQGLWRGTWTTIIALGIQLLLGTYLFLGGRFLARFWERMQQARPMKRGGGTG